MTPPFADTYYFIALINPDDEGHAKAVEYSKLIDHLVTTDWVFLELADGLAETPSRKLFEPLRNTVLADDESEVVSLDDATFREAIALYTSRPDEGWSLTDCVSFVVTNRHGLREALTADHHFEQAGFVALLK
jgi:uncharacterized protein